MMPAQRLVTLEPSHEPPKPDWYWLAPFVCFAAIVIPLFL